MNNFSLKTFIVNPFGVNTYLIYNDKDTAILIDPGFYFEDEKNNFISFVNKEELTIKSVILTHGHVDHLLGLKFLSKNFDFKLFISYYDSYFLNTAEQYANMFGFNYEGFPNNIDINYLKGGDKLNIGEFKFSILETPGHSPGSICIYFEDENIVFTGDTLFFESVGRADLPGGDYFQLLKSIRKNLFVLPGKTIVYPGHGPSTTIDHEKMYNPFIKI